MRHRLYYFLPDIESARRSLDDMLLSRIEQRHIRFICASSLPADMPEASFLIKTDVLHGAAAGMIVGAIFGMAFGALLIVYFELGQATVLVTTLLGILFGGWASSMAAAAMPNSQLKEFYADLERGLVLMIVDVPARRVAEIEQMLAARHPEMKFGGEEPHIPVFP